MTLDEKKSILKKYRAFLIRQGYHTSWIGIQMYWTRLYLASDKPITNPAVIKWVSQLGELGMKGRNKADSKRCLLQFVEYISGNIYEKEVHQIEPDGGKLGMKKGKVVCDMDCFNCQYEDCIL